MPDEILDAEPEGEGLSWRERLDTWDEDPSGDYTDDDEHSDELDDRFDAGERHLYTSIVSRRA